MDNDTEVRRGRVVEHPHIVPSLRQFPHAGDVVVILAGKRAGTAGKVAGRLDYPDGPQWSVMRDDGVIIGRYPRESLRIIMEGS